MSDTVVETITGGNTADAPMQVLSLTPSAIRQVKFLIQKKGNPNLGLRVGVKGGGCSGLSYSMTLDDNVTERDTMVEVEGIKVIVDRKSARFLEGTTLDYTVKNLLEGGWQWSNPNAQRSCGCGTSFTPR